jgi:hypothetical protein
LHCLAKSTKFAHAHWVVGKCRTFRNDNAFSKLSHGIQKAWVIWSSLNSAVFRLQIWRGLTPLSNLFRVLQRSTLCVECNILCHRPMQSIKSGQVTRLVHGVYSQVTPQWPLKFYLKLVSDSQCQWMKLASEKPDVELIFKYPWQST